MKLKNFLFVAMSATLLPSVSTAADITDTVCHDKKIEVHLTTSTASDKELKAQRSIDGERPVQPLNIIIGPSKLTLWGYAQTGYTLKNTMHKTTNALDVTRIILMAKGELTNKLNFFIMFDAAKGELHEYYGEYDFSPALKVRIGQYKQPFTLESIISPTILNNISYDPSVLYMAGIATDPCQGNHVGRDVGIMFTGDLIPYKTWKLLNYSIGVFNGPGMNQKENNTQKDVIGMLNVTPVKGLMLSTSFLLGTGHAQNDNEYGAFKAGEDYKRNRWACGMELKTAPLYARSELMIGNDGGIHSTGYYADIEAHVLPKFDIVADYDYLKKNNDLDASVIRTYMAGFQYWIYKRCRILSQYVHTQPRTGGCTNAWITQFQIGF
jgi:opacity protein-like surface antigen